MVSARRGWGREQYDGMGWVWVELVGMESGQCGRDGKEMGKSQELVEMEWRVGLNILRCQPLTWE